MLNRQNCPICVTKLQKFSHRILLDKYQNDFTFFYSKNIIDILEDVKTSITIQYKEYLFLDDMTSTYLRRFYDKSQQKDRIKTLLKFIHSQFLQPAPNLCLIETSNLLHQRYRQLNDLFQLQCQQIDDVTPSSIRQSRIDHEVIANLQSQENQNQQEFQSGEELQNSIKNDFHETQFHNYIQESKNICLNLKSFLRKRNSKNNVYIESFDTEIHDTYNPNFTSGHVTPRVLEKNQGKFQIQDYMGGKTHRQVLSNQFLIQKQLFDSGIKFREKHIFQNQDMMDSVEESNTYNTNKESHTFNTIKESNTYNTINQGNMYNTFKSEMITNTTDSTKWIQSFQKLNLQQQGNSNQNQNQNFQNPFFQSPTKNIQNKVKTDVVDISKIIQKSQKNVKSDNQPISFIQKKNQKINIEYFTKPKEINRKSWQANDFKKILKRSNLKSLSGSQTSRMTCLKKISQDTTTNSKKKILGISLFTEKNFKKQLKKSNVDSQTMKSNVYNNINSSRGVQNIQSSLSSNRSNNNSQSPETRYKKENSLGKKKLKHQAFMKQDILNAYNIKPVQSQHFLNSIGSHTQRISKDQIQKSQDSVIIKNSLKTDNPYFSNKKQAINKNKQKAAMNKRKLNDQFQKLIQKFDKLKEFQKVKVSEN